jgi:phosphoribosylanthranilate isomerase
MAGMILKQSTFVKICGLSGPADMEACAEAGADAVGLNFYPKSKRFLPLPQATAWLGRYAGGPLRVALFVNAPLTELRAAVETGCFEALQLHGDESPEFCAEARALGLPVWRAVALRAPDASATGRSPPQPCAPFPKSACSSVAASRRKMPPPRCSPCALPVSIPPAVWRLRPA